MKAIILAAGKGTRLLQPGDDFPKAMKPMLGKPLLKYVLEALEFIAPADINLVVGYKKEKILEAFDGQGYNFVLQTEQLGTGHAVKVCEQALADYDGPVLICLGDMPMIRRETFEKMAALHAEQNNDCTILTAIMDIDLPYGRIVRDADGKFVGVVEQKDCTPEQLGIKERNPSLYVFDSKKLFAVLAQLKNNNAQGEYYLTDAPALMQQQGMKLGTYTIHDDDQMRGVNTLEDLAECEAILRK